MPRPRRWLRAGRVGLALLAVLFVAVAGIWLARPPAARAATTTITTCDYATLKDAVANAASGDTLRFGCDGVISFDAAHGGGGTFTINKTLTISGNGYSVTLDGGNSVRLFTVQSTGNLTLDGLTVAHGKDRSGGGVYNQSGTLTIKNSALIGNWGEGPKGDSIFDPNGGDAWGGGVFNSGGTLIVGNSTFAGNFVLGGHGLGRGGSAYGGAIYSQGTATKPSTLIITNSTFTDNLAAGGAGALGKEGHGFGGGVMARRPNTALTITNSTFSGNVAGVTGDVDIPILDWEIWSVFGFDLAKLSDYTSSGYGGGVYNEGVATITNSTLVGNKAIGSGDGGGVNSTGTAGQPASVTIKNSIVAGNSSGAGGTFNCSGIITDGGYNLTDRISDCGFTARTDVRTSTPELGSLVDNGGPTQTIALLAGSPAIDQIPRDVNGCGTDVKTDQRGLTRPQGEKCDIGAFEIDRTPPVTTASVHTNGWFNTDATVTLKAEDNPGGSGVKASYYVVDYGTEHTYTAPFRIISVGEHVITYWSVDNLGNTESAKTQIVTIPVPLIVYVVILLAAIVLIVLIVLVAASVPRRRRAGAIGARKELAEVPQR